MDDRLFLLQNLTEVVSHARHQTLLQLPMPSNSKYDRSNCRLADDQNSKKALFAAGYAYMENVSAAID